MAGARSRFNRPRRRVRRGRGDFCAGKSHFPEQKSLPCSFRARKSVGFQRKLVGVAVAGELAPPSTSLSKKTFLTSCKISFCHSRHFGIAKLHLCYITCFIRRPGDNFLPENPHPSWKRAENGARKMGLPKARKRGIIRLQTMRKQEAVA